MRADQHPLAPHGQCPRLTPTRPSGPGPHRHHVVHLSALHSHMRRFILHILPRRHPQVHAAEGVITLQGIMPLPDVDVVYADVVLRAHHVILPMP